MSSTIDGDEKLNALETYPLTRSRRRQQSEPLSSIERSCFMSVNSSIGWLGMTASPMFAFYASHLQQMLPQSNISCITAQARYLSVLKKFGTLISYPRPPLNEELSVTVCVFADAGRLQDHGQLSFLCGVLLGPLVIDAPFYTVSWISHKSKRPVRSTAAAEILAVGEAIDEGKVVKATLSELLGISLKLMVLTDSKDLYNSLSTQQNATDRSVRADVMSFGSSSRLMQWTSLCGFLERLISPTQVQSEIVH